jgi:hypothetical protein
MTVTNLPVMSSNRTRKFVTTSTKLIIEHYPKPVQSTSLPQTVLTYEPYHTCVYKFTVHTNIDDRNTWNQEE